MAESPFRLLRQAIAASLGSLAVEIHDVLPEHPNPPLIAIGIPAFTLSSGVQTMYALSVPVTVAAVRSDFREAQLSIDDLAWQTRELLRAGIEGFSAVLINDGSPLTLEAAGQSYPAYIWTVEATLIC